jgi:hypothetical protein
MVNLGALPMFVALMFICISRLTKLVLGRRINLLLADGTGLHHYFGSWSKSDELPFTTLREVGAFGPCLALLSTFYNYRNTKNCSHLKSRVLNKNTPDKLIQGNITRQTLPLYRFHAPFEPMARGLQAQGLGMKNDRLHSWKQTCFSGWIPITVKRPEKGKPFERAGRKATGLSHEKTRDRVAEPPGDSNASIGRACLVNHRRRTYYDRCYSLVEN